MVAKKTATKKSVKTANKKVNVKKEEMKKECQCGENCNCGKNCNCSNCHCHCGCFKKVILIEIITIILTVLITLAIVGKGRHRRCPEWGRDFPCERMMDKKGEGCPYAKEAKKGWKKEGRKDKDFKKAPKQEEVKPETK